MRRYRSLFLAFIASCICISTSYAAAPTVDLNALTKGCLDPSKPEAKAQCIKLCKDGYQFYCDALKGHVSPDEVAQDTSSPPASSPPSFGGGTCDEVLAKQNKNYRFCAIFNASQCERWQEIPWADIRRDCEKGSGPNMQYCSKLCEVGCVGFCRGTFPEHDSCNIPDDKLPQLEGRGPETYAHRNPWENLVAGSHVEFLKQRCRVENVRSCHALCQLGCKDYCDLCTIGHGKFGTMGEYQSLEKSVVPPAGVESGINHEYQEVYYNCNPKTKKRGVGLLTPHFMGLKYGSRDILGYCNEVLHVNMTPMRRAFEAGELGNKDEYDGSPSYLELMWGCINIPACGPFFTKWFRPYMPGGSPETAVRPGDTYYDMWLPYVMGELRPGVNEYQLKPHNDGSPRNGFCHWPVYIDYSPAAQQNNEDTHKVACNNGDYFACDTLCKWGAGYEEYCALREEAHTLEYCQRYGEFPNQPACKTLCETGKSKYKKYCAENSENKQ